ncbi:MAG TPA: hypothetical protein VGC36_07880 [Rhizomicrobium sp.]
MSGPFDLAGKVVLVTGANTGIGQGIAVALAQAAAGRGFIALKAELGTIAPIAGIVAQTVARFGRIGILVNNAGTIRRAAAAFLSSAASDYVHGVLLPVDGGWLAR